MWRTHQEFLPAERLLAIAVLLATYIWGPARIMAQPSASDAPSVTASPTMDNAKPVVTPEGIGDARLVERRYQEAIEAYKNASNDSTDVWNKRGIAYEMLFDMKDAAHCYEEALRINPANEKAANNLGTVYDSLGEHRKAERLYRRALKIKPDSAVFLIDLGTNLMVQDKFEQGGEFFKRAFSLDRDIFDKVEIPIAKNAMTAEHSGAINYYKAKGFVQAGMMDRAIRCLRRAVDEGFTSPGKITRDSTFAVLHGNAAFEQLLTQQGE